MPSDLRPERGFSQVLAECVESALLALRGQDVNELCRARRIRVRVAENLHAALPRPRHPAQHIGCRPVPVFLADGFQMADLNRSVQRFSDRDHLLQRRLHAASLLPHVDGDGNPGILQRCERPDEFFRRIKALRRVPEPQ